MAKRYDLIVIGTGLAGWPAAYDSAKAGWKVAIADYRPYGGTCVLRGCMPKKVLVAATEAVAATGRLEGRGVHRASTIDWPALMASKRTFTDPVTPGTEKSAADVGMDLYHGHARFVQPDVLDVDGEQIAARHIVIATGARPRPMGIPGEEHLTTSEGFLDLDTLPDSIAFIGGGYISMEFAHVAALAGSRVTVLQNLGHLLHRPFDRDMADLLERASRGMGIDIVLNTTVTAVQRRDGGLVVQTDGGSHEVDIAVHGAGRVPEVQELDLGVAGVELGPRGILVNEHLQSVSNPAVYVVGDANGYGIPLSPVGRRDGRVVAHNLHNDDKRGVDYSAVPSIVFTSPPLATVGMGEDEARESGRSYRVNFKETGGWMASRRLGVEHSGFKVIIDSETDEVLGAHLIGPGAEELINTFALAVKHGIKATDLKDMLWGYPTASSDIPFLVA